MIDGTFHHPPDFEQLLILMYKDYITSEKIVGMYILMNRRSENIYDEVFISINRILTQNYKINLEMEFVVTDNEIALINGINKIFVKCKRIACYYHYKKDLLENIKKYGLYKNIYKETSNKIILKLGKIPIYYKGNIKIFENIVD